MDAYCIFLYSTEYWRQGGFCKTIPILPPSVNVIIMDAYCIFLYSTEYWRQGGFCKTIPILPPSVDTIIMNAPLCGLRRDEFLLACAPH